MGQAFSHRGGLETPVVLHLLDLPHRVHGSSCVDVEAATGQDQLVGVCRGDRQS